MCVKRTTRQQHEPGLRRAKAVRLPQPSQDSLGERRRNPALVARLPSNRPTPRIEKITKGRPAGDCHPGAGHPANPPRDSRGTRHTHRTRGAQAEAARLPPPLPLPGLAPPPGATHFFFRRGAWVKGRGLAGETAILHSYWPAPVYLV